MNWPQAVTNIVEIIVVGACIIAYIWGATKL